jgi:hypothetical protein
VRRARHVRFASSGCLLGQGSFFVFGPICTAASHRLRQRQRQRCISGWALAGSSKRPVRQELGQHCHKGLATRRCGRLKGFSPSRPQSLRVGTGSLHLWCRAFARRAQGNTRLPIFSDAAGGGRGALGERSERRSVFGQRNSQCVQEVQARMRFGRIALPARGMSGLAPHSPDVSLAFG